MKTPKVKYLKFIDIGARIPYLHEVIYRTNSNVMLIAYRGYSDSEGKPSETGLKQDSEAIIVEAFKRAENLPLYVYGRSLGGGVAVYASSLPEFSNRISGIILENTFTSIPAVVNNICRGPFIIFRPFVWLLLNNYWNSFSLISKLKAPMLLIKSAKDELIPKSQMDSLQ